MKTLSTTFFKMPAACLFFLGVPLFFFLFVLSYEPLGMTGFLDAERDRYSFNLVIITLILFVTVTLSRMLLFLLRRVIRLNWPLYILWCIGEVVFAGMMSSILVFHAWHGEIPYFSVMSRCLLYMAGVTVFPYALITMGIQLYELGKRPAAPAVDDQSLVRFHDDQKRLKFIAAVDAILFIEAEDNYVHIHHLHNGRVRDFMLRSSMRALEETAARHGLVRCHRSFFVNPAHITLVRKDPGAGYALAELDQPGLKNIPVSKSCYDAVSAML